MGSLYQCQYLGCDIVLQFCIMLQGRCWRTWQRIEGISVLFLTTTYEPTVISKKMSIKNMIDRIQTKCLYY